MRKLIQVKNLWHQWVGVFSGVKDCWIKHSVSERGGNTCYSRDKIIKIHISEKRQLLVLVSWVGPCEQLAQLKQKNDHCNFDFIVVWQLVLPCRNYSWRLSVTECSWGEVWNLIDFTPLIYLNLPTTCVCFK